MKKQRHEAILKIINEKTVATQEELQNELRKAGFDTTQATVSRDIRELRLVKAADRTGKHRYSISAHSEKTSPKYEDIFASSVLSVTAAMNDIVIKCYAGMANAACAALDSMNFESIVGTLAGDDTIFVITSSEQSAKELASMLSCMKK
ncbi:MAG: arginine repressor [Clostridia bacterium]|nr:arginine repressor [Clostridia bacterium]MEE1023475.1 arginine repressor [Acutalibacteraceae bacterium]